MSDLREFKAWFKGFKENIKKPNEAQWRRVCEEIEKLEEAAQGVRLAVSNAPAPALDPRFTPETMPKKLLATGAAMDAGVPKK